MVKRTRVKLFTYVYDSVLNSNAIPRHFSFVSFLFFVDVACVYALKNFAYFQIKFMCVLNNFMVDKLWRQNLFELSKDSERMTSVISETIKKK